MSSGSTHRKQVNKNNVQSTGKNKGDILGRVDTLEALNEALLGRLKEVFASQEEKIDNIARVINAIASIIGQDTVMQKVTEQRIDEIESQADATEKSIRDSLESGKLLAVESTDQDADIVVNRQLDKEGKTRHPSRVQIPLGAYVEGAKNRLRGAKVGDRFVLEDESVLEVLAIYRPVSATTTTTTTQTAGA